MHVFRIVFTIMFLSCSFQRSTAQTTTTVVPFLALVPDARAAAMGEAGVAVAPDANSVSMNAAKLPFADGKFGFSASYSPWLKNLVPDMNLNYLSAYVKPNSQTGLALSMRYFSLGTIQYTGQDQQELGSYKPVQLAVDAAYSRKLSNEFAIGTTIRYIVTTTDGIMNEAAESSQGIKTVAADVSTYYVHPLMLFGTEAKLSAGLNLSNISRAIQFKADPNKYYLPTNLRLGMAASFQLDDLNQFTFAVDLNKGLNSVQYINIGPDVRTPKALEEIVLSSGVEYYYRNQFAIRGGYLYENPRLGNRRYLTFGAGFKLNRLDLDVSYLAANVQKSPVANSLRFTLMFTFDRD
jgi:hypothetical protein